MITCKNQVCFVLHENNTENIFQMNFLKVLLVETDVHENVCMKLKY